MYLVRFHPVATPALRAEATMPEPFPSMEQVENANRNQIARWYRCLPEPKIAHQQDIMHRIADRFMHMGGMTHRLSKKIGITVPGFFTSCT